MIKEMASKPTKKYLLYTEEEGGDFHAIARETNKETQELFDRTIESKVLLYSLGDGERIIRVRPSYIAIMTTVEDFDFVIGKPRIKKKGGSSGSKKS